MDLNILIENKENNNFNIIVRDGGKVLACDLDYENLERGDLVMYDAFNMKVNCCQSPFNDDDYHAGIISACKIFDSCFVDAWIINNNGSPVDLCSLRDYIEDNCLSDDSLLDLLNLDF